MTVDLQFEGALNGIVQEILRSEKILESQQTEVMDKIGKAIKKKVEDNLPLSDEHGNGYKHMKRICHGHALRNYFHQHKAHVCRIGMVFG